MAESKGSNRRDSPVAPVVPDKIERTADGGGGGESKTKAPASNAPTPAAGGADGGLLYYKQEVGLSGWSEHVDDSTGRKYWFSSQTQESTWVEPAEVAAARAVLGHGDEVKSTASALPRAVDAHLGKVFADDRRGATASVPTSIREEAYVPVSFAKQHLEGMGDGMKLAQRRFAEQTNQMVEYYGVAEEANKAHYLAFINGLKIKAVRRIGHYKAVLDKTTREAAEYRKMAEETISSTQSSNSRLLVEKAALLKKMQEEQATARIKHAAELDKLRVMDGKEAEARRKKAAEIATALKAESKDLSAEKNQILSQVKAMQIEHKKNIEQVAVTMGKLAGVVSSPLVKATASDGATETSPAASRISERGSGNDPAIKSQEVDKPQTPRDIADAAELETMRRKLNAAKQTESRLREEIKASQAAALAAAEEASIPQDEKTGDMGLLRKQLAAAKVAKDSLLARNKSLEMEVEVSRKQVEAAEAAAVKATHSAVESAGRAPVARSTDVTDATTRDSGSATTSAKEINKLKGEIDVLKSKLLQSSKGGPALIDSVTPGGDASPEASKLRQRLEDANSELAFMREELSALREAADARESTKDGTARSQVDNDAEAAKTAKLKEIEEQRAALEKELAKAKSEASGAAAASAQPGVATSATAHAGLHKKIRKCIDAGRDLWGKGDKEGCATVYMKCAEEVLGTIGAGALGADILKAGMKKAKKKPPPRAAVAVRKAFDQYLKTVPEGDSTPKVGDPAVAAAHAKEVEALKKQMDALQKEKDSVEAAREKLPRKSVGSAASARAHASAARAIQARLSGVEAKVKQLTRERDEALAAAKAAEKKAAAAGAGASASTAPGAEAGASQTSKTAKSSASDANMRKKVKELEKKLKQAGVKSRQMENKLEKAEKKAAASSGSDTATQKALERRVKEMAKKNKQALDDAAVEAERQLKEAQKIATKAAKRADEAEANLAEIIKERDELKKQVASMGAMGKEMEELRAQASEVVEAKKAAKEAKKIAEDMTRQYKEESVLRKRYWNMMEDMKGKIRVFCRTRPMSGSEKERKCQICVDYPDEVSIGVTSEKGRKEFLFDQCFTPTATQEEVFEDASHLIQSAFDGFNVCVFAYGQTGSGKTFTMVGPPGLPGLTPRAIGNIFDNKAALAGKAEVTVTCYMAELYNDKLVDLLWVHEQKTLKKKSTDPPRLDIKKDSKGMVFIKGIVTKEISSVEEAMDVFSHGNKARHIGSTKMNSESSRSHLIFAILIENKDLTTHKTSLGKLSLVDLAGSESVGKTGATKERLKEAQSINKSLSALGDVISALSTGAKFIPYRNNKLTQMLSDGLGGNAKTLMFVNLSPADYNAGETTTALIYAARVKLIKNDAKKESDSEAVSHLKKIIHEFETEGRSKTLEADAKDGEQ